MIDLEGSILDEDGQFRGAAGTTGQPEDEGVSIGGISGVEQPVEEITLLFDGEETRVVGFVQEDGVGGILLKLSDVGFSKDRDGQEGDQSNSELAH